MSQGTGVFSFESCSDGDDDEVTTGLQVATWNGIFSFCWNIPGRLVIDVNVDGGRTSPLILVIISMATERRRRHLKHTQSIMPAV
mmetsp:Transcript_31361/g.46822  ORF Transcript_31361/g.46822 Transcript_31361/m.46822 type:complete len:85 (-) Transcript_31361:28-282(-)